MKNKKKQNKKEIERKIKEKDENIKIAAILRFGENRLVGMSLLSLLDAERITTIVGLIYKSDSYADFDVMIGILLWFVDSIEPNWIPFRTNNSGWISLGNSRKQKKVVPSLSGQLHYIQSWYKSSEAAHRNNLSRIGLSLLYENGTENRQTEGD